HMDALDLHLKADPSISSRLYEALTARTVGLVLRDVANGAFHVPGPGGVQPLGFDDEQSMLPIPASGFGGYRLLAEYFTLPERFNFIRIAGLAEALRRMSASSCELFVLLDRMEPLFESARDASEFTMQCMPAWNLFPTAIARAQVAAAQTAHHLVPDRSRPLDSEIAAPQSLVSFGAGGAPLSEGPPLYRASPGDS